jgi:hypothetical protein
VTLRQQAPLRAKKGFPWLVAAIGLALVLLVGVWGVQRWRDDRVWDEYVSRLTAQPGIVITGSGRHDGIFQIAGLRDPLAVDPMRVLNDTGFDPSRVVERWAPYQALDPQIVLKRLRQSLDPPADVTVAVEDGKIVARGSAPSDRLERNTPVHAGGRCVVARARGNGLRPAPVRSTAKSERPSRRLGSQRHRCRRSPAEGLVGAVKQRADRRRCRRRL